MQELIDKARNENCYKLVLECREEKSFLRKVRIQLFRIFNVFNFMKTLIKDIINLKKIISKNNNELIL